MREDKENGKQEKSWINSSWWCLLIEQEHWAGISVRSGLGPPRDGAFRDGNMVRKTGEFSFRLVDFEVLLEYPVEMSSRAEPNLTWFFLLWASSPNSW